MRKRCEVTQKERGATWEFSLSLSHLRAATHDPAAVEDDAIDAVLCKPALHTRRVTAFRQQRVHHVGKVIPSVIGAQPQVARAVLTLEHLTQRAKRNEAILRGWKAVLESRAHCLAIGSGHGCLREHGGSSSACCKGKTREKGLWPFVRRKGLCGAHLCNRKMQRRT